MAIHGGNIRKWTRDELEDAYLRLYDESRGFRRIIANQDTEIKTLNTKIMRIAADNKKFSDVYTKANDRVIRENQEVGKGKGLPLDKSAPLIRKIKRQALQNSVLEHAIKLLHSQNMQMKSRIKELESPMENQNKIICEKGEAQDLSKQRSALAESIELIHLKRQLVEKEKNIENLTTQLASIREELKLAGAEKCSSHEQEFQSGSRKSVGSQIKLSFLENQGAEHERENKVLPEFKEKILRSSTALGSDSEAVGLLLANLQRLESKMSASWGDWHKQYEEMCRIHNTLQTQAQSVEARIEALFRRLEENRPSRNLQELCESIGLDVGDLEAALIQTIEGTDADVHPQAPNTPQGEAICHSTERAHIRAAGRLDRVHRLPTTQHQVLEDHQRAMASVTDQFNSTQIRMDALLPEPGSNGIMRLGSQLPLPIMKSLSGESLSFEEGKNLFEINLGEINLTPDQLHACPNGVFCIWHFYNFEVQSTGIVRGKRSNFNLTVQYPVIMDELFWSYLHEKHCRMELHKVLPDLSSQKIGEFELSLHHLLRPESYASTDVSGEAQHSVRVNRVGQFRAAKQYREVGEGEQQKLPILGQVVYWMAFRAPIEHSLRNYLKLHQRSGLEDPGEAPSWKPTQRRKQRLSIELSVEEFTPQADFCFAYTFWRCPEYVSSVYKPPAADTKLITLKNSPQLDRYLRSCSLEVLLVEKSGSCLGTADIPLLELASGGSVNGAFQVHQRSSNSPKIPPMGVAMQWEAVTTANTRRASKRKSEKRTATEAPPTLRRTNNANTPRQILRQPKN